ncbi:MAG: hypothetical protein E7658_05530 [Ruminococcaceae bacterium]|nr:hypothetical protein [Oscillospiraceae bacterium]
MKKILSMLLISGMLCLMNACGTTDTPENETTANDTAAVSETNTAENAETEAPEDTADPIYYTVALDNGHVFEMGAIADDTVASLGEPQSKAEAPSCVHEGNDVLYTYSGFTLTTSPDADGNNRIQEIALTSDAVSLTNGLSIGSDKAAVEAAFGTDYSDEFGVLTFSLEGANVSVVLDADECVSGLVITAK